MDDWADSLSAAADVGGDADGWDYYVRRILVVCTVVRVVVCELLRLTVWAVPLTMAVWNFSWVVLTVDYVM